MMICNEEKKKKTEKSFGDAFAELLHNCVKYAAGLRGFEDPPKPPPPTVSKSNTDNGAGSPNWQAGVIETFRNGTYQSGH